MRKLFFYYSLLCTMSCTNNVDQKTTKIDPEIKTFTSNRKNSVQCKNMTVIFKDNAQQLPDNVYTTIIHAIENYFSIFDPIDSLLEIRWKPEYKDGKRSATTTTIANSTNGFIEINIPIEELSTMDTANIRSIILHELTHTQRGKLIKIKEPFLIQGSIKMWTIDKAHGLAYMVANDTITGYEGIEEAGCELIASYVDSKSYTTRQQGGRASTAYYNVFLLLQKICEKYSISPIDIQKYQRTSGVDIFAKRIGITQKRRAELIHCFTECMTLQYRWDENIIRYHL